MEKVENRGGIRPNSGPKGKPEGQLKKPVTFYIEQDIITTCTPEVLKKEAVKAGNRLYKKSIKNILK